MQENKDPAIKLFGQKIPFPGEPDAPPIAAAAESASPPPSEQEDFADSEAEDDKDKDPRAEKVSEKTKEADTPPNAADSKKIPVGVQNPNAEEESAKSKTGKSENDQTDTTTTTATNSQENNKTLKKPDKILPCPRCNSMDTKFCYYNNYNVNQPRYFCKACQRYWTAGGTMRNVPVGAGRRKNKHSASHYRHITISEALQAARIDAPNGTHPHLLKTNGRVLSFGIDPPICDSMASVLNLAEKKGLNNNTRNGFHTVEDQKNKDSNGDDCSSVSSITVSNEESGKSTSQESLVPTNNGFIHHVPCISTVPWPYPWNTAVHSAPALCPPGFPMSFYPAAAFWNIPWFPSHSHHSAPRSPSSGPNSPTLGKHSRDEDVAKQNHLNEEPSRQRNGSVLVPKTLRIDDPSEAAKSSIWAGDAETQNVNSVSSESKSIVASAEWKKSEEEGGLKFVRKEAEAFDLQELLRASAEVLGSGGFGSTYKAMLMNGSTVVVKRFKNMNSVGKKEFTEHMRRVGGLSHPNLVPLVAFYYGKEEKLLVHEFAENGSLASHLHGRGGCELDWGSRLKIIKGVARGLGYLYREFPEEEVVHGHLKSSNVMLDHSMEARLAEYGLGGVVEKRDAEQFMVAYKCPEGRSEKSDVWCLGILILEVVTGKFPANYLRAEKEDLTAWVKEVVDKWKWSGEGEMLKLLRIGIGCCEYSLESRWDWMEALAKIEDLKETDPDAHHFYLSSSISQDDFSLSLSLPTS